MIYFNLIKKFGLFSLILSLGIGISAIYADEADGTLEEIIVTAQKRDQAVIDTPIALTALSGSMLDDLNMTDITNVGKFAPNLHIISASNSVTGAQVTIRGGATANLAISYESSVGIYLNGAFIGKGMGSIFDIVDIERIEVLRGPQGTLYGKNTTGGAVNIISKSAAGDGSGSAKFTLGENGRRIAKVNFSPTSNGPMKFSFGFRKEDYDGWADNIADPLNSPFADQVSPAPSNDGFNMRDDTAVFLTMNYEKDNFNLDYYYDANEMDRTGNLTQVTHITPFGIMDPSPAAVAALGQFGLSFLGMAQYSCVTGCKKRQTVASHNNASRDDGESDGHSLIMNWDMGSYDIKSITTRRTFEVNDSLDHDNSPIAIARTQRDIEYEATSQEIQLTGVNQAGNVNWVAGYYHYEDEGWTDNPQEYLMVFGPGGQKYDSQYGVETDADAIYAQFDFSPESSPSWTYTLGARYTKEEKTGQRIFGILQNSTIPSFLLPLYPIPAGTESSEDFSNTIVNFIVSKQVNENLNLYFKRSEGWKAGAYNGETSDLYAATNAFLPQSTTSLEFGLKSTFGEGKGAFNLAVFQDTHEDKQEFIFLATNAAESVVTNFGEQEMSGVEAELYYQATPNLFLAVSIGTLDPKYNEAFDGNGKDVKDIYQHPFAAEFTSMVTVDYSFGAGARGTPGIRLDAYHSDEYTSFPDVYPSIVTRSAPHDLIDIRLYLNDFALGDNMTADLALWGKNVKDAEYSYTGYDFGGFGWTDNLFNSPADYGLDFTIRW